MSAHGTPSSRFPPVSRGSTMRVTDQVFLTGNGYQQDLSENIIQQRYGGTTYTMKGQGSMVPFQKKAQIIYNHCMNNLEMAQNLMEQGGTWGEFDNAMAMANEDIKQLHQLVVEAKSYGQNPDYIIRSLEDCSALFSDLTASAAGRMTMRQTRTSTSREEYSSRSFLDALAWINQQKRLIETAQFSDDNAAIEQQITNHARFHSSIQRSIEVQRAKDELMQLGDKASIHALDQEWDMLQKMSRDRTNQLRDMQNILSDISQAIMWVNDREEEELMFDWGDKNIDVYIPKKQESYSRLMSDLEVKEKELNKLKSRVDQLLKSNHPASDKIEAYMDTLQTQWSWLLQITKCIDIHLKENAAYSQFFKEANETYTKLQKDNENIRKKFTCNKTTPLESLTELLKNLEKEKERLVENKRQVQTLVNKSKNIVRLKPRNPEFKSNSPVIVKALCDFKQDQRGILKGNEAILRDNSQRSKWNVAGPGGLEMLIPSVCVLIPPPNPHCLDLASKNEKYYEAIMSIWNQLYINIKSLISWQYCLKDINQINSLTISVLSKMKPEEYRNIIKNLEYHYEEFRRLSHQSNLFEEADKKKMEAEYTGAQTHYDKIITQIQPANITVLQQTPVKVELVKGTTVVDAGTKTQTSKHTHTHNLLTLTHTLRRRLEAAESGLSQHLHVPLKDNSVHECTQRLQLLQGVHHDLGSIRDEYLRLRELVMKQEATADPEQAKFLRAELDLINQKLSSLHSFSNSYLQRLTALRALLQNLVRAEDIIKVHEARLTEKETSSLDLGELQDYRKTLKNMKVDLEQRKEVLSAMESDLDQAVQWNGQIDQNFHQCDVDLVKFTEVVQQMNERWHRIITQINTRLGDLEKQEKQLNQYKQTSSNINQWINQTSHRLGTLQSYKLSTVQDLNDHLNQHKTLHSEIKGKKDKVDEVQKDASTCAASIKDYELELVSYSAGLETLLNIPIKRTMLQSPATVLHQEAADIQSRYIELLTRSSDYYKFLTEMQKNMEELKIQNTKIDLLEEELRRLRDELQDRSQKNRSLEDILARYKLELSQTKEQIISMEEVKSTEVMRYNAAKENLDTTQNQLKDLNEQVARLTLLIDEEKRKRRLAEERYTSQQQEYNATIRKRQIELDELNWSKIDFEKAIKDKEREIERLKMQLEDEASRRRAAESETSKTSLMVHESQTHYKETLQERDSLLAKLKLLEMDKGKQQRSEEELSRIKMSLESEMRQKQRLQEEIDKIRKDFNYWKSQYEIKDGQVRQCQADKDKAERDRASLSNEITKLTAELRSVEQQYRTRLQSSEFEVSELTRKREALERELRKLQQRPSFFTKQTQTDEKVATIDPSKLVFDGIRRKVTAHQLCDCGIIDKATLDKLLKGQITVSDVSVEIQPSLKGTGVIAGVQQDFNSRMPITEAKSKNLLSPQSAIMLLEAQAATGHVIDPKYNEKMPVDTACSRGIVDTEDRDILVTAEAACTGFKDPFTGKLLSVGQACKKGRLDKEKAIRLLQAQEAVGGIIDPVLSVFLPRDTALDRGLIDEELYRALNKKPACYINPATAEKISYSDLRKKCVTEPTTGLLLLPVNSNSEFVQGIRGQVSLTELVNSNLINEGDLDKVKRGLLTTKDIENRLKMYLSGSGCIAGIYDEAQDRVLPFYQAMKENLLRPGTTLELLEAQAASGFMIDPVNNVYLTVEDAWKRGLVGKEFKDKLLSAEKAVTGYRDPSTGQLISLFQAIEKEIIEKGHGIRLLEAQIASGGIIDPKESHRIDVEVAYRRGYFDREMNEILTYEGDDTKGFFDPNTHENLTYLQLQKRCISDPKTGLLLLALKDKNKQKQQSSQKNTLRKRRVVIVDPDTGKEMSVREAFHRELIDYDTFLNLSEQECEWEEITITDSAGKTRLVIVDRKTGTQYDVQDSLDRGVIQKSALDQYRSGALTLTQFANLFSSKGTGAELSICTSVPDDVTTCSSPTEVTPSSPTVRKRFASVSITLSPPSDILDDQSPVAAIFDTETLEKITITEAQRRGIVDAITAQRLLEAQACTGGVINPATGKRLSLQDAVHQSIIDEDMATKLKPAQKAYTGFEDVKTKKKMSAAEAIKEKWLPYEAGQRFLEFQYLTGGLLEPGSGKRVSIEEAIRRGWLDGKGAQKLQDTRSYLKSLTCPKTKLKISYKEAMDNCMVEETNGMKMLQATSMSTKGISSPYNISSGHSSRTGSRAGSRGSSRSGSRRGSVDYSTSTYTFTSTSTSSTFTSLP
ncbi:desmoplakin-A isoform X3 [Pangasianodon hypophthalmus]|uniref:desmoplakin-A isoform X3 n=1 Tax=Pangasianodon hypophthalmus TaxID=310915 RepID=UPI00147B6752|nr:desmoplakin-A isoform X3 [Pangasianodon hypophthalmus]